MNKYSIIYSQQAKEDIEDLFYFIVSEYKTFQTAKKYVDGIEKTILKLRSSAESFQIQTHKSIIKYGANARRVNYKRMSIIYTVHGSVVFIHRIVAASLL